MIKIIISFLLMAMITGCVQTPPEAEKPEEAPVVEQPEKNCGSGKAGRN